MDYTAIEPNKVYSMDSHMKLIEDNLHLLPENVLRISKSMQLARAVLSENSLRESAITLDELEELMEEAATIERTKINFAVGLIAIHCEYESFDFDRLIKIEMAHISRAIVEHRRMTA